MELADCRRFYAQEVRWCGAVKTAALIEGFARVPREVFLGPAPWKLASPEATWSAGVGYVETSDPQDLYHNVLVALDAARNVNNGQPSALGRWMDALALQAGDRVLHVGCGVGYYTAVMAEAVGPRGSVAGFEVDGGLAARAKANLAGYRSVEVQAKDGAAIEGLGEFDAILINAGVTHPCRAWLDGLREGGRMVLPVTSVMPQTPELGRGAMMKLVRKGSQIAAEMVSYVGIYSCISVRESEMNAAIGKALAGGGFTKIKSLRRDVHQQEESCVVHGRGVCWSGEASG
jgi:protein-L-isoaspartate(D-aspartate) O-methyltransferase